MSIITVDGQGYTEDDLVRNWAASYAQREVKQLSEEATAHKEAAVIDHPDGSVTTPKLADGAVTTAKIGEDYKSGINARFVAAANDTAKAQSAAEIADAKAVAAQNTADLLGTAAAAHKEAAVIDHPDGCVTTAKLADGAVTIKKLGSDVVSDINNKIDTAVFKLEEADSSLSNDLNNVSDRVTAAQSTADAAQSAAEVADAKADAAQSTADTAQATADAACTSLNSLESEITALEEKAGYGLDCLNRFNCNYYEEGVYINAKPDYIPKGTYLFMPEQTVPYIFVCDAEGTSETAVVEYNFKKGYIYLINLVEDGSENSVVLDEFLTADSVNESVNATIGYVSEINDDIYESIVAAINGITSKLNTKNGALLGWTKVLAENEITEDVDSYSYTLPSNCMGVVVRLIIPADVSYGSGYINASVENGGWIGSVYSSGLSTTSNPKEVRLAVFPHNGYYYTYGAIKSGSNATTMTRYEVPGDNFMKIETSKYISKIAATASIYAGSKITIWGLFK